MSTRGTIVWITGMPRTGKTTLGRRATELLRACGHPTIWLDGDELRHVMTPEPTYSDAERDAVYGTLAWIAERSSESGTTVIISATAGRRRYRDALRARSDRFIEVLLSAPIATLEARDDKGLYRAAGTGDIDRLPGVGTPYEAPTEPELSFDTSSGRTDVHARTLTDLILGISDEPDSSPATP